MKTEKWMSLSACAALLLATASCDDWGKQDPPAGGQVAPTLENVAAYDFESEEGIDPSWTLTANPGGMSPQIIEDETKGKVLEINNGFVSFANPLNKVTLQKAVSLTFWLYQPVVTNVDEEGNETAEPQDLASPLITFVNGSENATLSFNANGGINYSAADGDWIENDPSGFATGYLKPGEWHYVAIAVDNDGYDYYVDGDRKVSKPVIDFDCSKIVKFANNVPTMTIGSAGTASRFLVDDLKVYRNKITEKEIKRPNIGGGSTGPGGFDFSKFDYILEDPVFNIGNQDCTTAWWTAFSNYYRIPANTAMNFRFVNHTSGAGNWNNWNLCVSTDADRGEGDYKEYFVIRSDLYGWGEAYNGDNFSNVGYGDWDKFRVDMEGAIVNVQITRSGNRVDVKAVANCKDGTVYVENFFAECGDEADVLRAFFICDGSYLEFDKNNCYAYLPIDVATPNVGANDNSSAWWSEFSDYFTIPAGQNLHLGFTNHTSGGGNWNNWNLCVSTEAERGDGEYKEYFVIRSDLYGWGEAYNGDNWSNEGYGDWDAFRVDMEGAYVNLTIERSGATVNVKADALATNGNRYIEMFHADCDNGDQNVNAFLIMDASHINIDAADCYLYVPVYK